MRARFQKDLILPVRAGLRARGQGLLASKCFGRPRDHCLNRPALTAIIQNDDPVEMVWPDDELAQLHVGIMPGQINPGLYNDLTKPVQPHFTIDHLTK
jgi:hypothetical protein